MTSAGILCDALSAMSFFKPVLCVSLALCGLSISSTASAQNDPRYLGPIRAELTAMGLTPQCAAVNGETGTCRVRTTVAAAGAMPGGAPTSNREFTLTLEYSDASDTIYVYADHYATLQSTATTAATAFRRMLEMNWEMLVGKLEWSPSTGEIRLGAVMHTDSNFDRRAFRGVVRAVVRLADRYAPEMAQLTAGVVGGAAAPHVPGTPAPTPAPTPAANPGALPPGGSITPMAH